MNALTHDAQESIARRLAARIDDWRRWRAERGELEALGCEPARRILADCGLTIDDLDRMTNPKAIELLPEMMKLVGAPDNAATLFAQPDIDGGLIGGAALKAPDFVAICRAAG